MRSSWFVAVLTCAAASAGLRIDDHIVHEKRDSAPIGWKKVSSPDRNFTIPMRIALAQSNLDKLDGWLSQVSDPTSEQYGKYWDRNAIAKAFEPSQEAHDAVRTWLINAGIPEAGVIPTGSKGWLQLNIPVHSAQKLLKAEYAFYEHAATGTRHIACEEYHVPRAVQKHIDFITPTLHFDLRTSRSRRGQGVVSAKTSVSGRGASAAIAGPANLPKLNTNPILIDIGDIIGKLDNCDKVITPDCLRALYQIPPEFGPGNAQKNPFGILEFTPGSYLQSDLDMFFGNFSKSQKQKTPKQDSIDGGYQATQFQDFNHQAESDLDIQYGMALANPIPATVFQVGDVPESGSFNNFLDAIDGSYCNFEGGDDPSQDSVFPDTKPGGYDGPATCGQFTPTSVISDSYAVNEHDLTPFYAKRQCQEYAKLGLAGTTFLVSSGDSGVAGNQGACIDPQTGMYNNGTSGKFNPEFPPSCPYVTAVGATQVKPGASVTAPEMACETVIWSGGGFSNIFPMPDYQKKTVADYYAKHNPPYGADRYNNSRQVRAFPDVSANGAHYILAVDGAFRQVYGTSASTPTVAAMIAIINEVRAQAGKGPVGFINPVVYANPQAFNDVIDGGNQGCGTPGFSSTPGWDPVTGAGTPNMPKLLEMFLGLA